MGFIFSQKLWENMSPKFWKSKYTQRTSFSVNIGVISARISTTGQKPKNAKFCVISSKQFSIQVISYVYNLAW